MQESKLQSTVNRACPAPSWLLLPILCVSAAILSSCSAGKSPSERAVGYMDDATFDRARGTKSGVNAEGDEVGVDDYEGGFLWVEHTAPWYPPCRAQAPILGSVAREYSDVTFLVLLTATTDAFTAPTQDTAVAWANQHGLEPELVVAKYRNDTRVIPQHRLFSPDGQLLFYHVGQLPQAYIEKVLDERIPEWKDWNDGGDEASWMR